MTEVWLRDATTVGVLDISAGEDKTIGQMAYEFERGFWQKWIFGLVTGTQDEYGYVSREYESIHTGGPVAKRLQALGILREAGVEIARYHEAVEEDRPLIAWARDKYKPRLFAAE